MGLNERPEAVLVAGPTATGKSSLALALAEDLGGTIVNADSMQVYDCLRVVTARPSEADEARVPHRLYGDVPATEPMSAARYTDRVSDVLPAIRAEGRVPIFVGGTGLYMRALEEGLSPVPAIDPEIRTVVRAMDAATLHGALLDEDPDAAKSLRPSDTQRMARALEVVRSTGRGIGFWHERSEPGPLAGLAVERILLMPERSLLHRRIAARSATIVRDPAAHEEVRLLELSDPEKRTLAAKAIGVRELGVFLRSANGEAEAIERLTVATRRYAKRQSTWFNNSLRGKWRRVVSAEEVSVGAN